MTHTRNSRYARADLGPVQITPNRIKILQVLAPHAVLPTEWVHELANPKAHLTPIGSFLRKSSLDELPQLWSIIRGDMSFVGPRPALFNQDDLIAMRTQYGVHELAPGLTGWAQINGRDELPIPQKIELDAEYLRRQSFWFDMKIIGLTVVKVIKQDSVTH